MIKEKPFCKALAICVAGPLSFLVISSAITPAVSPPAAPATTAPSTADGTAAKLATVTPWITGLRSPQGMARDKQGNIYIAEYNGGQVLRYSATGKLLNKIGQDLKNPAWVAYANDTLFIAERKANQILSMDVEGKIRPIGGAVEEPLGLAVTKDGNLIVVSHTTSRILSIPNATGRTSDAGSTSKSGVIYAAPATGGKRYGYRCVAADPDGNLLITDETDGRILLLTPSGRLATWVSNLDDPTAVVFSPKGEVYVAEEGAGRIKRIDVHGATTIVAEGLGQARDIEFLDEKTMLVSDRKNGTIWHVKLP